MRANQCALCPQIIMDVKGNGKLDISNYAQVAYKINRDGFKKIQRLVVGVCGMCFRTGMAFDARNFTAIEKSVRDGWEREFTEEDSEEKRERYRKSFYPFKIIGIFENGEAESPAN